jgi:hypothetical protein
LLQKRCFWADVGQIAIGQHAGKLHKRNGSNIR